MGSGVSKGNSGADDKCVQQSDTKCSDCQAKVTQRSSHNQWQTVQQPPEFPQPTRNIRFINNGEERLDYKEISEVNKTTKKFYYYPQKDSSSVPSETFFVSTSKFPYTRPKAVAVRPKQPGDIQRPDNRMAQNARDDLRKALFQTYESDFKLYHHAQNASSAKPVHIEQAWSVPNVVPADDLDEPYVLPHKTVLELRKSSQMQPYGRHYKFSCDLPPSVEPTELTSSSRKRPPTPVPSDWFPVERTNDYLVASSLLAAEQQIDKSQTGGDIHNF